MNKYIQAYIDLVRSGITPMCREQYQLADLIEKAFAEEDLFVDEDQLERYMGLLRYFPYKLLPWESFLFALHNCVYTAEGDLRWPCLGCKAARWLYSRQTHPDHFQCPSGGRTVYGL